MLNRNTAPLFDDNHFQRREQQLSQAYGASRITDLSRRQDSASVEHQGVDDITVSKTTVTAGIAVLVVGILIIILAIGYFLSKGPAWGCHSTKKKTSDSEQNKLHSDTGNAQLRPLDVQSTFVGGDVEETELRTILVLPVAPDAAPSSCHRDLATTLDSRQNTDASEHHHPIPETRIHPHMVANAHDVSHAMSISIDQQLSSQHVHLAEQSPSTAKLVEPQATSVFTFIKGNNQTTGSHMPVLTRTKARLSIHRKGKNRIFPQSRRTHRHISNSNGSNRSSNPSSVETSSAAHSTHSANDAQLCSSSSHSRSSSCSVASLKASKTDRQQQPSTALIRTASSSSSSLTTCDSRSVNSLQRNIFSPIYTSRIYRRSNTTTVATASSSTLRLDLKNNRSGSVMALFGSPRSSPSGSVADGASMQALYCPSLKSAMSLVTNTDLQSHHHHQEDEQSAPSTSI
ncbi:hypothetical protein BG004_007286 [Podila humilis]|nr:hypothetical protein BG004_007286 [Podila humilis]